MSTATEERDIPVLDFVGIGFGPSNLALAVAMEERNQQQPDQRQLRGAFFEKQARFGWHRGMLIEGTTMQVSFLKDLVTMRNPTSPHSFLCYLQDKGRLADFINHKMLFPTRVEFHDYLEWVAGRFEHLVSYDSEVVSLRPVHAADGAIEHFDVVVRQDGRLVEHRARNIVLAAGLQPNLPPEVVVSERVWHNQQLLHRLEELPEAAAKRFIVVGAGQSAAETTEYLHRRYADAQVHAVFARYGYAPADDSAFVNGIFDPEAVDYFFSASDEVKRMLLNYHRGTNYSAVDIDLIDQLYARVYQEKVRGVHRMHIHKISRMAEVHATPNGVRAVLRFLPTGELSVIEADVLVYATGYRPVDPLSLLGELGEHCHRDERGELRVERDYRVSTQDGVRAGIYLQGATESSHGITSTLLSNTAVRVGEILDSILLATERPTASLVTDQAVPA
ncbi:lysine N(6)-hydroxylase/L-ornithine N(5)-oxygenase family protein [Crossiella sp. CA-258035]|uniref:lysine N(6)-hydroxylase/L-ornithine N(5)-oxygenase family protein n=1 Tax=Crossiella sp. CA-258035 TaxID=2981138 RepID=UPI0024BC2C7D|nr:lysine N(6)-hydroxylase/L-ornithine N(5)-oxygenase family protein [Crossiella sp. CA-258035]WHT21758.1 lysine N(6)-hydroxylase/L-ornithine N(5)-oxygenase family protein [Crossiella sp. CA-258035]